MSVPYPVIRRSVVALVMVISSLGLVAQDGAPVQVDPELAGYTKQSGISGNISSVGSDTLNNLMALWAEGFRKQYPNVNIQVEGKGSSTAPPALIQGVAQLGPMSRPMKGEEIEAFEKARGYKPTAIGVGLDALAVYVNKDNPIEQLTLAQVDGIFSSTRKSGYHEDIRVWGQLGLGNNLQEYPISLYGRNSASGTYGFFKEHALAKGDFKNSVKEQPGSASVVMAITEDLAGIGYSGIGYITSGVKTLKISAKEGTPAYDATAQNVIEKKYPLGRLLLVYIDINPKEGAQAVTKEFLKFVLSKEGQEVVVKSGYIPLPGKLAKKQEALLEGRSANGSP